MRRLTAILGILLVLALVATLFWRVWVHHNETLPLNDDPTAIVSLDASASAAVKISGLLS